jgi:acetyl/propionyl-CoA carboxylase alpha subunit
MTSFNEVLRDGAQSTRANTVRRTHPEAVEYYKSWYEHTQRNPRYKQAEDGGAYPQVDAVFFREDPNENHRQLRQHTPDLTYRMLLRANNGSFLKPQAKEDLEFTLKEYIRSHAPRGKSGKTLFVGKIFDSQGITAELANSVGIFNEMRGKGHAVALEIAIPYSIEDIYPDEFYVKRVEEAFALLLTAKNIPMHENTISLKDMIGEMDAAASARLMPKIITKLKELATTLPAGQKPPSFALHCHCIGPDRAAGAYIEAMIVCEKMQYPLSIDTLEHNPYTARYKGKESWKNTGFLALWELDEQCRTQGIDLGLTAADRLANGERGRLVSSLFAKYDYASAEPSLTTEELVYFEIPGGGFSSYSQAVQNIRFDGESLSSKLAIREKDALRLVGHALRACWHLMGCPFAVTPGFQNKQIAGINLITNMMNAGMFDIDPSLQGEARFNALVKIVETPLSDKQVEALFLKNLKPEVVTFLKGEMPAETLQKMGIPTSEQVHPVIRQAIKRRDGLSNQDAKSRLEAARAVVDELFKAGKLPHTESMDKALRDEFLGQPSHVRLTGIKQRKKDNYIAFALSFEDPSTLKQAILQPWFKKPDPARYVGREADYQRAMRKYAAGKNPGFDEMEMLFRHMQAGTISFAQLQKHKNIGLASERADTHLSMLKMMKENQGLIAGILADDQDSFILAYGLVQKTITDQVKQKEAQGQSFIFSEQRLLQIAEDYFYQQLAELGGKSKAEYWQQGKICKAKLNENNLLSPLSGTVLKVHVQSGDVVKAGQALIVIESMKIQSTIYADRDTVIDTVNVKAADNVKSGNMMLGFKAGKPKNQPAEMLTKMKTLDKAKLEVLNDKLHDSHDLAVREYVRYVDIRLQPNRKNQKPQKPASFYEKVGIYAPSASFTEFAKQKRKEIHVFGNRSVALLNLLQALLGIDADVRIMHTEGDKLFPLLQELAGDKKIIIDNYTDQDNILEELEKLAIENPHHTIYFHPGWGFLSENADFVAKLEKLAENYPSIKFVGPSSKAMAIAGGKISFRQFVDQHVKQYNPGFFANHDYDLPSLADYVVNGFSEKHPLHTICKNEYAKILKMGGDVAIKADAGGGGMGIKHFIAKPEDAGDYQRFVRTLQENIADSKKKFGNSKMLTEQWMGGKTRHVEVQVLTNRKGVTVLPPRDCTAQMSGQKIWETTIAEGDYKQANNPVMLAMQAARKIGEALSKIPYEGLVTLEGLVDEQGNFRFLEANTRLQVEHKITELLVYHVTGVRISLPLINYLLVARSDLSPAGILQQYFGMDSNQIMSSLKLINQHYEQVRLNSNHVSLPEGKASPAFFWGDLWPGHAFLRDLHEETGAELYIGDIGAGVYNAHCGTVVGSGEEVLQAAEKFAEAAELARVCMHEDGDLSVAAVIELQKLMYDDKGNFHSDFSTNAIDGFLKAIRNGEVELDPPDYQHLGSTPKLAPGSVEKAFREYIVLQAAKEAKSDFKPMRAAM